MKTTGERKGKEQRFKNQGITFHIMYSTQTTFLFLGSHFLVLASIQHLYQYKRQMAPGGEYGID